MHSQDPITKLTQTLQRDDGSQVRIVAQGIWKRAYSLA